MYKVLDKDIRTGDRPPEKALSHAPKLPWRQKIVQNQRPFGRNQMEHEEIDGKTDGGIFICPDGNPSSAIPFGYRSIQTN